MRIQMNKLHVIVVSVLLMVICFTSCEHRSLEDPYNGHYVRIYIDEQIKNVTYGFYNENRNRPEYKRPNVLRITLCDPVSDEIVAERYLQSSGEDERGYYIDGYVSAEAGKYNMMVYNFGTEKTKVRDENIYSIMQAYTSSVSSKYYQYFPEIATETDVQSLRYCPDHLYLAVCEPVEVKKSVAVDTLRTATGDFFTAQSIVQSYYMQVRIKGFEYVKSAVSLLSGMAGSITLHNSKMNEDDPVDIFFDMDYTDVQRLKADETNTAVLYTTFNTFGKLPEEQNIIKLNFEFIKSDGTSQVETIDITSMFDTPIVKNERWILLEKEIEIIPPIGGGGGMTPGVDIWEDIWTDIQL